MCLSSEQTSAARLIGAATATLQEVAVLREFRATDAADTMIALAAEILRLRARSSDAMVSCP